MTVISGPAFEQADYFIPATSSNNTKYETLFAKARRDSKKHLSVFVSSGIWT